MKTKQLLSRTLCTAMFAGALLFGSSSVFAQVKIGTNPTTIAAGSGLEVEAVDKGIRFPQVSLTSTTVYAPVAGSGTAANAPGMTVYNTNSGLTSNTTTYPANGIGEYYWDGTGWVYKNATTTPNLQVVFSLRRNAAQTLPAFNTALAFTDIAFDAEQFDKNNNYNLANRQLVVPTGGEGYYQFNIVYVMAAKAGVPQGIWVALYVNGAFVKYIAIANAEAGSGVGGAGCGILQLAAGDIVKFKIASNAPSTVISNFFQLDAALISRF